MKKIKLLGSSLFISILLAFLLPLPIMGVVNDGAKDLSTQTVASNQQPVGDYNFDIVNSTSKVTVTVHTTPLLLLTPDTIPQDAQHHFDNPNDKYFSYSNASSDILLWKCYAKVDNINHSDGKIGVKFYGYSQHGGEYGGVYQYLQTSLVTSAPTFSVKTAGRYLPSSVTTSNLMNYVNEIDTKKSFIKASKVTSNDNLGNLYIDGSYYTTTFHGGPTLTFSTTVSGFATNTTIPTITFNGTNIGHITEADFKSKIVANNPTKTLDNLKDWMTVTNIDHNAITNISYTETQGSNPSHVTITYHSTSWSGSSPATQDGIVRGFASKVAAPTISTTQGNIAKITEGDFESKIVANNPSKTIDNLKGYVSVTGIAMNAITNISYANKTLTVTYHENTWSGSAPKNQNHGISGFAKVVNAPTIEVNKDNIATITDTVFAQLIVPNNPSQTLDKDHLGPYVTINGTPKAEMIDISFASDSLKIKYHENTYATSTPASKSFDIKGFAIATSAPTITLNDAGKKVLPSVLNNENYRQFLNVSSYSAVIDVVDFKSNDVTGHLEFNIKYYTSTYHGNKAPVNLELYKLDGFALSTKKPTLTANSKSIQVLPTMVDANNYKSFITITDPDNSLIPFVEGAKKSNFVGDDSKGTLTINGTYYETTAHTNTSPIGEFSYTLINKFAIGVKVPKLTVNDAGKKVLPSTITPQNYATYIDIDDPDKALINSTLTFKGDDSTGQLTIGGTYYVSNYRAMGAPTESLKPQPINGFSFTGMNKQTLEIIVISSIIGGVIIIFLIILFWYFLRKKRIKKLQQIKKDNLNSRRASATERRRVQLNMRATASQNNPNNSGTQRNSVPNTRSNSRAQRGYATNNANEPQAQTSRPVKNQNRVRVRVPVGVSANYQNSSQVIIDRPVDYQDRSQTPADHTVDNQSRSQVPLSRKQVPLSHKVKSKKVSKKPVSREDLWGDLNFKPIKASETPATGSFNFLKKQPFDKQNAKKEKGGAYKYTAMMSRKKKEPS